MASSRNAAKAEGADEKESAAGNVTAETRSSDDPGSDAQAAINFDEPLVNDDEPCTKYEASFGRTLRLINEAGIPYRASQNSNAVVNTMLVRSGLGWLQKGGRFAPGAGTLLLPLR